MNDKLPPSNDQAEKALLGCIMLNPDLMAELRTQAIPDLFYSLKNRLIWEGCCEIVDSGARLDLVTLSMRLSSQHLIDQIGVDYIGQLEDETPSALNWREYLNGLRECYVLRSLVRLGTDIAGRANDASNASSSLLDLLEQQCAIIRAGATPGRDFADNKEICQQLMNEYRDALEKNTRQGIPTGFYDIDKLIGGLKAQELIVVAGSPSAGKTSWVLNVAQHVALNIGETVGMLSLETSAKKILHRNNCSIARVNGGRLLTGQAQQGDIDGIGLAMGRINKFNKKLILSDRGGLTAHQACAMFRRMHQKGARLLILDYLQLLRIDGKTSGRTEEVSKISNAMKAIAKELECPLIVICAINREASKEGRPPRLSDLRESGQLEFDADIALLLHPKDDAPDVRTVEVNVAKNKDGETGKATLTFFPPQMRFESAA